MMTKERIQTLFDAAEIRVAVSELDDRIPLAQQGLDSLDMANFLFQIEQSYKIVISPEDSARLRSIDNIVGYLDGSPGE